MDSGRAGWALEALEVEKPHHKHKCKKCAWVASFGHPSKFSSVAPCDVYLCLKDAVPRIVCRYGKGPGNVVDHLVGVETSVPEFNEGMRLVSEKGMLP